MHLRSILSLLSATTLLLASPLASAAYEPYLCQDLDKAAKAAAQEPTGKKRAKALRSLSKAIARISNGEMDVNKRNKAGLTPLMEATQLKHTEAISWLIARGAEPCLKDKKGRDCLDRARKDAALTSALKEGGIFSWEDALKVTDGMFSEKGKAQWREFAEQDEPTADMLCTVAHQEQLVRFLLRRVDNINEIPTLMWNGQHGSPSDVVGHMGISDEVRLRYLNLMYAYGADFAGNSQWNCLATPASHAASLPCVKWLVEHGVCHTSRTPENPGDRKSSTLCTAVDLGNVDVVRYFLSLGGYSKAELKAALNVVDSAKRADEQTKGELRRLLEAALKKA